MTPLQPRLLPIKMVEIELGQSIETYGNLHEYQALKALVRLHGTPLGYVQLGVTNGQCSANELSKVILANFSWPIIEHLICDGLATPLSESMLNLSDLLEVAHPNYEGPLPVVTVAVCTRDRAADLELCLLAIEKLNYPDLEILVVDNAPSNTETRELVTTKFPAVRYICEQLPGLSRARNKAISEANGEIIAFTDDDVVVDKDWVLELAKVFVERPRVMAVTGLVVPYELETPAQILFEYRGGFGRGFQRRWFEISKNEDASPYLGAGQMGTGANMAFRRRIFSQIGSFDVALGVGTPTQGGEDLDMFLRIVIDGHPLVYEPQALVQHRHRRDFTKFSNQTINSGTGLASFHAKGFRAFRGYRYKFLKLHFYWLWQWHIKRLLQSYSRPTRYPRELILAEMKGYVTGLKQYKRAQKAAGESVAPNDDKELISQSSLGAPVELNNREKVTSEEGTRSRVKDDLPSMSWDEPI